MALYLKNVSGGSGNWDGVSIADNAYYLMTSTEQARFASDDQTVTDIGAGDLIVATSSDGNGDITSPALGMQTLLGNVAAKIADPFPLNEGDYSFRGAGGSATLNGSGTNSGVTDADILINETRYVDGADIWFSDITLFGVSVDFIVVDKDGVGVTKGWYTQAQFDAMGNYYEVGQFGYDWQLHPRATNHAKPGYPALIYGGLYVRMKFQNPNVTGTTAYYNLDLHKKAGIT
jgi:hypothetical protein